MSLCCCLNPEEEDTRSILDLVQDAEIPVKNRKRTDFQCFVTLAVYFSFLVICVSVAGSQADLRRFIHGYDDRGNLCGVKNDPIEGIDGSGLDLTDKKFLQVTERCNLHICSTERECVHKCENEYTYFMVPRCVSKEKKEEEEKYIVFPEDQNYKSETKGSPKSFFEMVYSDISLCWREMIVLCLCSIGLSGLILSVLRMFPKIVIKIIIIIVSFAAVGWTIFSWMMMGIKAVGQDDIIDSEEKIKNEVEMMNWLYIALVFTIFTAIFFLMLYKMRNKIKLIAVLFEEGGKCIKDIPTMLLPPVLTYLITAVFACFVCFGLVCFQTSGKPEQDWNGKVYYTDNVFFQITSWLLFFAFLWLSQFFLACQNLVIAGSVSSWYFSRVKGKLDSPVWRSFNMVAKHHLGSAAFGSLLIAIIKAIRFISRMMERKSRENGMAALIWGILQCLLACIESVLRILNKSAYVMIAGTHTEPPHLMQHVDVVSALRSFVQQNILFGQPFCNSARRAFACLTSDSSKVALIIGVGTFILTSIQLLVTASVTFVGIALFMNIEGIQIFWIPASLVFVLSYMCCHCFFSVYEMAIDTLILCFCVDHQMNDGLEKPYYMNHNLMILLNEDNRRNSDEVNLNGVVDHHKLVVA